MTHKILYFIKSHNRIKDALKLAIALSYAPIVIAATFASVFFAQKYKNAWIIGELGTDAKDNGYAFFRYLRSKHPEINAFYYIYPNYKASEKVMAIGKTIIPNSWEHKVAFMSSEFVISTQDMYPIPFGKINWREFKIVYGWLSRAKFVFLQHGITKDDASKNANYRRTRFDYFVTTVKREYDEITSEKYGYPRGNVIETGFPRFDSLLSQNDSASSIKKSTILFMPTWRRYLADATETEFLNSEYYKQYESLLSSSKLADFLSETNSDLMFMPPHQEIQKFLNLFNVSNNERIHLTSINEIEMQPLLKKSSVMVTDYSSIAFDFTIQLKPLIYFQYDVNEFRNGHYKSGYFSYENDGHGPIVTSADQVVDELWKSAHNHFEMEPKYLKRAEAFFDLRDTNNSERLFKVITMR